MLKSLIASRIKGSGRRLKFLPDKKSDESKVSHDLVSVKQLNDFPFKI